MDCVRTSENSGTALIVSVISWTQKGALYGSETHWKDCAGNGIDGRHRLCNRQVTCDQRGVCLRQRAHVETRGRNDGSNPIACRKDEG